MLLTAERRARLRVPLNMALGVLTTITGIIGVLGLAYLAGWVIYLLVG